VLGSASLSGWAVCIRTARTDDASAHPLRRAGAAPGRAVVVARALIVDALIFELSWRRSNDAASVRARTALAIGLTLSRRARLGARQLVAAERLFGSRRIRGAAGRIGARVQLGAVCVSRVGRLCHRRHGRGSLGRLRLFRERCEWFARPVVSGGAYDRSNDPSFPATVSNFRLDRYEVTVGRFRSFVAAYPGSKPAVGDGAHPLISGSGWQSSWDSSLPADQAALIAAVNYSPNFKTWTDAPGANETQAMNYLTWYQAFAFCAWDGGRLPTEAEWNYAAADGSEQRVYPWSSPPSSTTIDCTLANFYLCGTAVKPVGGFSAGDGRWGQADLAGNVQEWNLDGYATPYSTVACTDCGNLTSGPYRVMRGGSFYDTASPLRTTYREAEFPDILAYGGYQFGARCARAP
jgi:formylglycine-generating enzyme